MEAKSEQSELLARLGDLSCMAERGEIGVSAFLSEREIRCAETWLMKEKIPYIAWGGYPGAERKKIYLLPEYLEDMTTEPDCMPDRFLTYGLDTGIGALKIRGSGYVMLSHRDFLGALLGLGLERAVLGDILVGDGGKWAVLFCEERLLPFLEGELTQVGRDTVRTEIWEVPADFSVEKRFSPIHDTVASARLDSIVAALCGLSRERARQAVTTGLVELEYICEERPDKVVVAPAILSVRGYGKFRILSVSEQTKKGRYRLSAEKYL